MSCILISNMKREITQRNSEIQFSHSVMSDSLWPHGLQHTRLPCPSRTPGVYPNSCPLSRWYHPTIYPLSSPSPSALNLSQHQGLFQWVSSFIRWPKYWSFSFSISPSNEYSGLISCLSKGFSRVFSNTIVQKHQLFDAQPSLWFKCPIHTWLLEKPVCKAEIPKTSTFQKPLLQRLEIANIKHLEPGRLLPIAAILYYLSEDVTFQIVANVAVILYTASDN